MNFLNKLERKFGRFAIRDLMKYIAIGNAITFVFAYLGLIDVTKYFVLVPSLIAKGEIWRLFTFIFIPQTGGIFGGLLTLLYLYFLYYMGRALEQEWGTFKFNVFYLLGIVGCVIGTFIANNIGTPEFLNMSLLLAFAFINPNMQIRLFLFIPLKIKYLGIAYGALIFFQFFSGNFTVKILIAFSLINFLLFFGKDIYYLITKKSKNTIRKKQFYHKVNDAKVIKTSFHRCHACGRTEIDDKSLEFRYCSICEGDYEYCSDHLKNHEHINHFKN